MSGLTRARLLTSPGYWSAFMSMIHFPVYINQKTDMNSQTLAGMVVDRSETKIPDRTYQTGWVGEAGRWWWYGWAFTAAPRSSPHLSHAFPATAAHCHHYLGLIIPTHNHSHCLALINDQMWDDLMKSFG